MPYLRRFIAILLLLIALCHLSSLGQTAIPDKLRAYNKTHVTEKPYLQFDKPYYATGDTLWFKAYLLKASYLTPSSKSIFLYIDIANDSNKVVKQYYFRAQSGSCWGNIALNDIEFPPGTYTLRAYTNWMRNWGDESFFYRRFYISSTGENNWLVNSRLKVSTSGTGQKMNARLLFSNTDKIPFAAKPIDLQVMNGDRRLYRQTLQTDNDGAMDINFNIPTKNKGITLVAENQQKDKKAVIPLILNCSENADVQFLPEGGNLVAGFPVRMGFKAIGEDGKGIDISGIIIDHEQKQVADFQSINKGMGSFDLTVKEGESYTAKVKLPDGLIKDYTLPAIKSTGTILRLKNEMASDSIEVIAGSSPQSGSNYFLLGEARSVICYAAVISLSQSDLIKRKIAKSLFPTGITHFILMTTDEQVLNERLVFIDHRDNLNIQITGDKPVYACRDSIGLQLLVSDKSGNPVLANFSMAVTDDAQVITDTANNDNILTRLLLTSDLKGYVEEPGYYLNHTQPAWQALDNLLLTQGWVNYEPKDQSMPYEAEQEFKVSGKVSNVFNTVVKGTRVMLLSKSPEIVRDTLTDANGRFIFDHFPRVDTPVFVIQAVNKNGKSFNVALTVDETTPPNFSKPPFPQMMPWYVNSDTTLLRLAKNDARAKELQYFPRSGHMLNEVKITAKKVIKDSYNLNGPGNADQVIDEKELENAGHKTVLQLLKEKIPGFKIADVHLQNLWLFIQDVDLSNLVPGAVAFSRWEWYYVKYKPVKFIVDGTSATIVNPTYDVLLYANGFNNINSYLQSISAEDVKGIELMFSDKYGAKYSSTDIATIEITTRSGHGPVMSNTPGRFLYKHLPITPVAQFYKPRYLLADTTKHSPDLRSTIDWAPNVITDINGKGQIAFYAADKPATYTIIIEGTDMMGNFGFKRQKITITSAKAKAK